MRCSQRLAAASPGAAESARLRTENRFLGLPRLDERHNLLELPGEIALELIHLGADRRELCRGKLGDREVIRLVFASRMRPARRPPTPSAILQGPPPRDGGDRVPRAYTRGPSKRIGYLARRVGEELGLDHDRCRLLDLAGQVHDIGLLSVPDRILNKPNQLGSAEFRNVRCHSEASFEILQPLTFLADILPAVKYHHERMNGTGYPYGIGGEEIPLTARILAVVDAYDAMMHDRPHRAALPDVEALAEIRRCTPDGYDADCVAARWRRSCGPASSAGPTRSPTPAPTRSPSLSPLPDPLPAAMPACRFAARGALCPGCHVSPVRGPVVLCERAASRGAGRFDLRTDENPPDGRVRGS